nr:phosphate transporter PHO1 [Ipomoea batatas]
MVKFSKELEAQLIPEWKDAFVNYWQLKKQVKKIKLSRRTKPVHDGNDFGLSFFDRVRGFVNTIADKLHDRTAAGKSETNAQFFRVQLLRYRKISSSSDTPPLVCRKKIYAFAH